MADLDKLQEHIRERGRAREGTASDAQINLQSEKEEIGRNITVIENQSTMKCIHMYSLTVYVTQSLILSSKLQAPVF